MKKIWMILGIIVIVLIGGILLLNFNKNHNNQTQGYNQSIAPDEQNDYVGEDITIITKDFRAIIKKDWQNLEIPPSTWVYLPPNIAQEDVNAEVISITVTFLGESNQYTLTDLFEQGIENSEKIMSDFELTETIDWKNNYLTGKKIKFTGTSEGVKRNTIQTFGIKYNNLYTITYSCPVNSCNSYAVYNSLSESFQPAQAK